jgi:transposase
MPRPGKGNPYLKRVLADAAASVVRTNTFLGERHRRLVKHRGKRKAIVAVAPLDPGHRLAPARRPDHPLPRARRRLLPARSTPSGRTGNLIHQLEILGHRVTLTRVAVTNWLMSEPQLQHLRPPTAEESKA